MGTTGGVGLRNMHSALRMEHGAEASPGVLYQVLRESRSIAPELLDFDDFGWVLLALL